MPYAAVGSMLANRYRLQEFLGRGAYGEVWRAMDCHRTYEVAVKLLLHKDRGQAWHEASLLTALRSGHILSVNNADVAVDVPYIDTDLAKCSVDQLSRGLGLEPRRAIDFMRRSLRGLGLCHTRGLLHRDVKPANLFLDKNDDCRLGDFGVAALMNANGEAPPHGDPYIRAPEFYTGGSATVLSDVYAAGVTLYALLAGRMPFDQSKETELVAAISTGTYPKLRDLAPHVSQALDGVVKKAMECDPSLRYQSAQDFDSSLGLLPRRKRHFAPIQPHTGHDRCWSVTGKGSDLIVCISAAGDPEERNVSTRRDASGSRVKSMCRTAKLLRVPTELRRIFGKLQ